MLHPDKRAASEREKAQREFDQLQKAYDILLDPEARAALENLAKARAASRARAEQQEAKRRKLREDLEARERAAERGKNEEEEAKERLQPNSRACAATLPRVSAPTTARPPPPPPPPKNPCARLPRPPTCRAPCRSTCTEPSRWRGEETRATTPPGDSATCTPSSAPSRTSSFVRGRRKREARWWYSRNARRRREPPRRRRATHPTRSSPFQPPSRRRDGPRPSEARGKKSESKEKILWRRGLRRGHPRGRRRGVVYFRAASPGAGVCFPAGPRREPTRGRLLRGFRRERGESGLRERGVGSDAARAGEGAHHSGDGGGGGGGGGGRVTVRETRRPGRRRRSRDERKVHFLVGAHRAVHTSVSRRLSRFTHQTPASPTSQLSS